MSKVKDLIRGATWRTATGFNKYTPDITVILPTYCRGDSGFFQKAVDSILNQTFKNFELIIVDDCSRDSTASLINHYIESDRRIACIRHSTNIGLPAISVFEAYMRSRGEKIFFAFDDNVYKHDALQTIWEFYEKTPEAMVCYCVANVIFKGTKIKLGKEDFCYDKMLSAFNHVPNTAITIDRRVFEDIGLYDPHVCLVRLCDWDLWIRIGRKYKFHRINKVLATEHGPSLTDSLENSYSVDIPLLFEWVSTYRNDILKPKYFLEYDVIAAPTSLSSTSQAKLLELMPKRFEKSKRNVTHNYDIQSSQAGYILVLDRCHASFSLWMDTLPANIRSRIIILPIIEYHFLHNTPLFLNARAVVMSRRIFDGYLDIADALSQAKIPYYYYTDDNFFEIYHKDLNNANKRFVRNAKNVITTTNALAQYFKKHKLSNKAMLVNPAISGEQFKNVRVSLKHFKSAKEINIVFGSNDRLQAFINLADSIKELARAYTVTLHIFVRNLTDQRKYVSAYRHKNITLTFLGNEQHHSLFVSSLAHKKIHFFLHPLPTEHLSNVQYKTLNFLINGYLTSSIVLVPDAFPYNQLKRYKFLQNLVVPNSDAWVDTMRLFLSDYHMVKDTFGELEWFCKKTFSSVPNVKVIESILQECPAVDCVEFYRRTKVFAQSNSVLTKLHLKIRRIQRLKKIHDHLPTFLKGPSRTAYKILHKYVWPSLRKYL